jgi:hypothetical protein
MACSDAHGLRKQGGVELKTGSSCFSNLARAAGAARGKKEARMKTKVLLTTAAVILVIISTVAIGSNMGFKISIPLVANAKSNWVSIPYYNSYPTALAVFNDVPNCLQVTHWTPSTDTPQSVTSVEDPDFALVKGEFVLIKVSGSTTVNWIVVGSHDPSYNMPLTGSAKSNWLSVPYHATSTTALTLFSEIPNCLQVTTWNAATDTPQSVTSVEDPDFAIVAGQGYLVKVSGADATWLPAHY